MARKKLVKYFLALLLCLIFGSTAWGAEIEEDGRMLRVATGHYTIQYDLDRGSWDLRDNSNQLILKNAFAGMVLLSPNDREKLVTSLDAEKITWEKKAGINQFGESVDIYVNCLISDLATITTVFRVHPERRFLIIFLITSVP